MDFSTSKTYPNYLYSPETNFTLSQPLIYLFIFFYKSVWFPGRGISFHHSFSFLEHSNTDYFNFSSKEEKQTHTNNCRGKRKTAPALK